MRLYVAERGDLTSPLHAHAQNRNCEVMDGNQPYRNKPFCGIYRYQIITSCTLNLHHVLSQLYFSKTGKKAPTVLDIIFFVFGTSQVKQKYIFSKVSVCTPERDLRELLGFREKIRFWLFFSSHLVAIFVLYHMW